MRAVRVIVVMLALAALTVADRAAAETPCDDCWNEKCGELKGIVPKCKPPPKKDVGPLKNERPKVEAACPVGQERNADTAGHCCWSGQAWNGARCVGIPASCPPAFDIDVASETCALPACAEGMARALDGVHCCWPGQAWSSSRSQCLGEPKCAAGWALEEGRCTSPDALRVRAETKRLTDEAAARDAAAEAERVRQSEAEARRVAAERERERIETEQREAALRAQRAAAEAAARAEQEANDLRQREQRRVFRERQESAELQRTLAQVVGGLSVASLALGTGTTIGGAVTNAEIGSGKLATADDITATAERGELFNVISWGTLLGGGVGLLGSIVWYAFNGEPDPP